MSIYPDREGLANGRIRRSLSRRVPPAPPDLDEAKTQFIRKVAGEYPNFTPDEVFTVISYEHRRSDITKDMVRHLLLPRDGR